MCSQMQRERERVGAEPNDYSVYDCRFIDNAKKKKELICNPIYEWEDTDVWEFIRGRGMKYNPLYDRGNYRIGCIGCPMNPQQQQQDLEKNPIYALNYKRAFDRMVKVREKAGKVSRGAWKDGESVYKWWIQDQTIDGQMTIEEFLNKEE